MSKTNAALVREARNLFEQQLSNWYSKVDQTVNQITEGYGRVNRVGRPCSFTFYIEPSRLIDLLDMTNHIDLFKRALRLNSLTNLMSWYINSKMYKNPSTTMPWCGLDEKDTSALIQLLDQQFDGTAIGALMAKLQATGDAANNACAAVCDHARLLLATATTADEAETIIKHTFEELDILRDTEIIPSFKRALQPQTNKKASTRR